MTKDFPLGPSIPGFPASSKLVVDATANADLIKAFSENTAFPERELLLGSLGVDFDGTVLWNGTPVDRATLDGYLEQAAAQGDAQPEIHLQPNRLAKYDAVAKVLADAQRIGVTHIGFTGIENMQ